MSKGHRETSILLFRWSRQSINLCDKQGISPIESAKKRGFETLVTEMEEVKNRREEEGSQDNLESILNNILSDSLECHEMSNDNSSLDEDEDEQISDYRSKDSVFISEKSNHNRCQRNPCTFHGLQAMSGKGYHQRFYHRHDSLEHEDTPTSRGKFDAMPPTKGSRCCCSFKKRSQGKQQQRPSSSTGKSIDHNMILQSQSSQEQQRMENKDTHVFTHPYPPSRSGQQVLSSLGFDPDSYDSMDDSNEEDDDHDQCQRRNHRSGGKCLSSQKAMFSEEEDSDEEDVSSRRLRCFKNSSTDDRILDSSSSSSCCSNDMMMISSPSPGNLTLNLDSSEQVLSFAEHIIAAISDRIKDNNHRSHRRRDDRTSSSSSGSSVSSSCPSTPMTPSSVPSLSSSFDAGNHSSDISFCHRHGRQGTSRIHYPVNSSTNLNTNHRSPNSSPTTSSSFIQSPLTDSNDNQDAFTSGSPASNVSNHSTVSSRGLLMQKEFSSLTLSDEEQRELYLAARTIQKAYRGYQERRKSSLASNASSLSSSSNNSSQSMSGMKLPSGQTVYQPNSNASNNVNTRHHHHHYHRRYKSDVVLNKKTTSITTDKEKAAAILIQSYYRRYKQYVYYKQMTKAAQVIQSQFRNYCSKRFKTNVTSDSSMSSKSSTTSSLTSSGYASSSIDSIDSQIQGSTNQCRVKSNGKKSSSIPSTTTSASSVNKLMMHNNNLSNNNSFYQQYPSSSSMISSCSSSSSNSRKGSSTDNLQQQDSPSSNGNGLK